MKEVPQFNERSETSKPQIDRRLDNLDLRTGMVPQMANVQERAYEDTPDPAKQLKFYKKSMKIVTVDHNDKYLAHYNVHPYDYGMKEAYEGRFQRRGLIAMIPPSAVRMSRYGTEVDSENLHQLLDEYTKAGKLDRRFDQYTFGVGMSGDVVMFDLNGEQVRQVIVLGSYRNPQTDAIERNPYYRALKDFGMTMETYWTNLNK